MSIDHYIKRRVESINKALNNFLPLTSSEISQAARYMVLNGGRRWRPLIMIASGEIYNKNASKKIMSNACAIELGHVASLIFDDKMDSAIIRRGKPSCHIKFGEAIADLTGIHLINRTYSLNLENNEVSPENTFKILTLISKSAGLEGLVGGQEIDIKGTTKDKEDLKGFYTKKSGGLYAIAAAIGGILFNANKEESKR